MSFHKNLILNQIDLCYNKKQMFIIQNGGFFMTIYNGFDLTQKIPTATLFFLGIICIVAIALPIFLFQFVRKKFLGNWQTLLFGTIDYLIMEVIVCNLILFGIINIPGVVNFVDNHKFIYILFMVLIVAVVDEIGRYLLLDMSQKRYKGFGNILIFAIGIAGSRSILVTASQSFQSTIMGTSINQTGLSVLVEELGENADQFLQSIQPLLENSSFIYFLSIFDVVITFLFHIALSIIIFAALKNTGKKWMIGLAMFFRFLYELPVQLHSYGIFIKSFYIAEGIVIVVTLIVCYFAWKVTFQYLSEDLEELQKQKAENFPKYGSNLKNLNKGKNSAAGSIRSNANIMANKKNRED